MISECCPIQACDGSGWIWYKDWVHREEWMEECCCREGKIIREKLVFARIPTCFQDATLNSFDTNLYETKDGKELANLAKKAAINYFNHFEEINSSGKGLFLTSNTKGSGKTRLLASIANGLIKRYHVELIFITAEGMFNELKHTFNSDINTMDVLKLFQTIPVLIIDDFGVEARSDWTERTWTDILDARLVNKRITLFSSNFPIDALEKIYPAGRLQSRVKQLAIEIPLPEEAIRERLATQENLSLECLLFQ